MIRRNHLARLGKDTADQWPYQVRLPDLEGRFVCKRTARCRCQVGFDWEKQIAEFDGKTRSLVPLCHRQRFNLRTWSREVIRGRGPTIAPTASSQSRDRSRICTNLLQHCVGGVMRHEMPYALVRQFRINSRIGGIVLAFPEANV